jgi:AcrR family transcriptional regulator
VDQDLGTKEIEYTLEESVLEAALQKRRDYPIQQDPRPEPTPSIDEHRELELLSSHEAAERRENETLEQYDVPSALEDWLDLQADKVERAVTILQVLDDDDRELTTYDEISTAAGVSRTTISTYFTGCLEACVEKIDGEYVPNTLGEEAIDVSWMEILEQIG